MLGHTFSGTLTCELIAGLVMEQLNSLAQGYNSKVDKQVMI